MQVQVQVQVWPGRRECLVCVVVVVVNTAMCVMASVLSERGAYLPTYRRNSPEIQEAGSCRPASTQEENSGLITASFVALPPFPDWCLLHLAVSRFPHSRYQPS
ncbi:hypothetical protein BDP81DRAFT_436922 [Colletotrichum phormii]|uniref:Uncharacterized protein n=1 Tax=Colletotrichum phormii TaxID=359342 RepID=A0AAI9ZI41_9PEZI|nr:uncharacterized protein BDP81DRAFT_436922 [Colletotrichum phormii]KAK1625002.1 hypothetical protein BDP81DRAFT_436922 [Colletotrichum phormii]